MPRIRGRIRRRRDPDQGAPPEDEYIEIDPRELAGVFAAPNWLRDVGVTAWLLVGVALALVGAVWLLSLTEVIVIPVITAAVIASVMSPVVGWLHRHRIPRPVSAILVLVAIIALGFAMVLIILGGITSELGSIQDQLGDAKSEISNFAQDVGVDQDKADNATKEASSTTTEAGSALLNGVLSGVEKLSSLVFFLAMTVLSLVFLLADGPKIRGWAERRMGVPLPVARVVTQRMIGALRGYFLGVSIVAAFSAVVVAIGAFILGVPLVGTIVVVTFVGGFIPYLGAWTAAAFSVLLALGGAGPEAALGMVVVQLLANSVLQQLIQPLAMGAALGIHPLAVLIVTIAGGALFGAIGLILAAPIVSAMTRISTDLARARAEQEATAGGDPPPPGTEAPAHA